MDLGEMIDRTPNDKQLGFALADFFVNHLKSKKEYSKLFRGRLEGKASRIGAQFLQSLWHNKYVHLMREFS